MGTYSFGQLEQLWENNGGNTSYAATMAAIALAESGGNPQAVNPTDNNGRQTSWGLWQISNGTHNWPSEGNPLDPNVNAALAVSKLQSQGLTAWGTYDSKAYMKYLPANNPASLASVPGDVPAPSASTTASSSGSAGCSGCAVNLPSLGPIGGGCLITSCNLKALKGGLLVAAGGITFIVGGLVLVAFGVTRTSAGRGAAKALEAIPAAKTLRGGSKPSAGRRAADPAKPATDEGDELFEEAKGSRTSNRAYYRRQMRSGDTERPFGPEDQGTSARPPRRHLETSDLRRRTG